MHRATPAYTSFRAYSAGGARAIIDAVDDSKLMQAMSGGFMKAESRKGVESPQNYGFTSVVHDADKDAQGNIIACAEGLISFLGGSRSLPMCGVMDDRRHRLWNLAKGDVAMFRGKDDQQQFHLSGDGGYWSAPDNKTVRMQLVPQKQQQGAQQQAAQRDSSGGSTGGSQGGQQQQKGQQAVYKDGKDNGLYVDVTKDRTTLSGKEAHLKQSDGTTYVHVVGGEVYLGAEKGKASFGKVSTDAGVSVNVYAKVGSMMLADEPASNRRHLVIPAIALLFGMLGGIAGNAITTSLAAPPVPCAVH